MTHLKNKYWDLIALLSGILLTLSFSPFDFSYLALIALIFLFVSWQKITPQRAALRGYLFGLGLFGSGVSWVYVSVHDFGGGGIFLSLMLTLFFVGFWALFPAVSGYLSIRFFQTNSDPIKIVTLPTVWILIEYLRGNWVFNGFPWFQIAYSQLDTPLAGYIPILGAYGTGLILAFTASVITLLITNRNTSVFFLGVIACLWLGGWVLQNVSWTHSVGKPVKITMIQGNISQDKKWQPEYKKRIMKRYKDMTYQHWDSQVIIWPESAVPAFYHQVSDDYLLPLEKEAKKNNTDLVISLPIKNEKDQKFNAVMTFGSRRG
ncbi:MAG: apolipoprotein N-acyltransferase, partial [Methyloprofundus sp.]|nr:apolipoprotein N-acyltransferase [Methyloprofundus sp.]